jgi:hypothetical protein
VVPEIGVSRGRILAGSALAALCLLAAACGGGGSSSASSTASATASAPSAAAAPNPIDTANLAIAQQLYDGVQRTPSGFLADPPPSGVTGVVATTHLKSTDIDPAAASRYELCTDDLAQATAWSESRATWGAAYTDLVQVSSDAQRFEFDRVPRNAATAMLRQRVFRCSYVDRSGSNLDVDQGPAGLLAARPVTAAALQGFAEYLWHFTAYNNADTIVTQSVGSGAAPALVHAIKMAQLQRGASSADCDTITLLQWVHTADAASGALVRRIDTLGSFRARNSAGTAQLCP